jgi:hypothetical protein
MVCIVPVPDFFKICARKKTKNAAPLLRRQSRGGRGALQCPGITCTGGTHRYRYYGTIATGGCQSGGGGELPKPPGAGMKNVVSGLSDFWWMVHNYLKKSNLTGGFGGHAPFGQPPPGGERVPLTNGGDPGKGGEKW